MILIRIAQQAAARGLLLSPAMATRNPNIISRWKTYFRSGALKPKPEEMPFGFVGVLCAVIPGLFLGAAISKSVANFLEENDLFVPDDDDDED